MNSSTPNSLESVLCRSCCSQSEDFRGQFLWLSGRHGDEVGVQQHFSDVRNRSHLILVGTVISRPPVTADLERSGASTQRQKDKTQVVGFREATVVPNRSENDLGVEAFVDLLRSGLLIQTFDLRLKQHIYVQMPEKEVIWRWIYKLLMDK